MVYTAPTGVSFIAGGIVILLGIIVPLGMMVCPSTPPPKSIAVRSARLEHARSPRELAASPFPLQDTLVLTAPCMQLCGPLPRDRL
jgi:hypothetical protein